MGAIVSLFPNHFISQENWDPEEIATPRQGLWRWAKCCTYGSLAGVSVGFLVHWKLNPLDWKKIR